MNMLIGWLKPLILLNAFVGGNPGSPQQALFKYYIVQRDLSLRYPPQYAVAKTDSRVLAVLCALSRSLVGRDFVSNVYDKSGQLVFGKELRKAGNDNKRG